MRFLAQRKRFGDLSEREVVALAISSERDDARIYRSYAEMLRAGYPGSAALFDGMAAEEDQHRARLIALHQKRFGATIPLIRREHVAGCYNLRPVWPVEDLGIGRIRDMEAAQSKRQFVLTREQAGPAGLMDGSVSTLAPIPAPPR